ncbi:hypothetical protein KAT92_01450, partial [Candidatus Babeliales bacterium]|nr:hypothetical protein [Candidatus Babeliales bacterium]
MRKIELFFGFLLLLSTVGISAENQVSKIVEGKERCFPVVYPWDKGDGMRVQIGTDICSEEKSYLASREPFVKDSIKKLISVSDGENVEKVPKIAFCMSGGGYRAMIGSLGFLLGAESIGLLGATSYIASLSGSSWLIGNLFTRMKKSNITLQEFHKLLRDRLTKTKFLDVSSMQIDEIVKKITSVLLDRYKIEPIDLWGILLIDRLLGDLPDAQNITFDEMRSCLAPGDRTPPFPLFSLVVSDVYPYEWLEVTPFVSGSDYLRAYVPTEALDSIFKNGKRVKVMEQRSLGWFLGLFGSSYNASLGDVIVHIA